MRKAEGKAHTAKAITAPSGATKKPMPDANRVWAVVGRWSGWRWQGSSGRAAPAISCLRHPNHLGSIFQRLRSKLRSLVNYGLRNTHPIV